MSVTLPQEKQFKTKLLAMSASVGTPAPPPAIEEKAPSVDEEVRLKKLKNDDLEQDIKLKRQTLQTLFIFLGLETLAIFAVAILQGIKINGFALEEWSFKLLIGATIAQITVTLQMAVKYLFPVKETSTQPTV